MAEAERTLAVFRDLEAASEAALEQIVQLAERATAERGRCYIALAGGKTPENLYESLTRPPALETVPWSRMEIFFGDERCVGPNDPESNYGMVRRALLDRVPVPAGNVHRIKGELPPADAARSYEEEIRSAFGIGPDELPRFDLILLGMGPDGHTASLFPNTEALAETERMVVANHVPQLDADRVTLTLPVLNNARDVIFLVSGRDKSQALFAFLEGGEGPKRLPSQYVRPVDGRLTWLVDLEAVSTFRERRL